MWPLLFGHIGVWSKSRDIQTLVEAGGPAPAGPLLMSTRKALTNETKDPTQGDDRSPERTAPTLRVPRMNIEGLRGLEALAAIEDYSTDHRGLANRSSVRAMLHRSHVLVLATTDKDTPWIAALEYLMGDDLDLFFFSSAESRHARNIEANNRVAVTVFDHFQPTITGEKDVDLKGVQMECIASRLDPEQHTDRVNAALERFHFPVPPYAAFKIVPQRVYVPRVENGVNIRYEVDLT